MILTKERFTEILQEQDIPVEYIEALWTERSTNIDEEKLLRWAKPMRYLFQDLQDGTVALVDLLRMVGSQ